MAEETIACPQCGHQVRVPTELLGEQVQCPDCGSRFTAPIPTERGGLTEAAVTAAGPSAEYTREQALLQVRWPAVCLLLTGLLGFGVNGSVVLLAEWYPEKLKGVTKRLEGIIQPAPPEEGDKGEPKGKADGKEQPEPLDPNLLLKASRISGWIFLGGNVLTILAAVCTLTLRFHWLAFTGSILATVNFGNCCCALGLPMGLWVIVNLTDTDVKQHFR